MKNIRILLVLLVIIFSMTIAVNARAICGDAIVDGTDECDDGPANSDIAANACRTNCKNPKCGDDVVDSGEACDNGPVNSDLIPNAACRKNCMVAHCGDGVLDNGEECDDANTVNPYDGCNACKKCYIPSVPHEFNQPGEKINICSGEHQVTVTELQSEIITIKGDYITLDCNGAELVASVDPATPTATENSDTWGLKWGTAIVVEGNNVLIRDCNVSHFDKGVFIEQDFKDVVLVRNKVCWNNEDIVSDSTEAFGALNSCASDWRNDGAPRCMGNCFIGIKEAEPLRIPLEGTQIEKHAIDATPVQQAQDAPPAAETTPAKERSSEQQKTIIKKSFWERLFQKK